MNQNNQDLSPKTMPSSGRFFYLDVVRIFAVFWVIWNHSTIWGWQYWMGRTGIERYISLFLACFCKISVPLFLMISGALLLGKSESISELFKKRVSKMLYLMALVAVTVYLYWGPKWGLVLSLDGFVKLFYSSDMICSYYLWLYLGFLLALPLLREVVKNRKVMTYSIVLFFALEYGFPLLEHIFKLNVLCLDAYTGAFQFMYFFPIIGYAIHTLDESKLSKKGLIILGGMAVVALALLLWIRDSYERQTGMEIVRFDYLSIFLSMFIFYSARMVFRSVRVSPLISKITEQISAATLGTFLISAYYVEPKVLEYAQRLNLYFHPLLSCMIMCVVTLVLSQAITALLRLIPPIRKIL